MRTQIAKTGYLPAEYIPHTFLTRTPPPFAQVDGGGAAIEKNFFDFYFSDFSPYSQNVWIEIFFFIFFARILLVFLIISFTPRFLFYHSLNFARSLSLS